MTIAIPFACIHAEPVPCITLATINIEKDSENPPIRAPMIKIINPDIYIFFLPMVSASRPIGKNNALVVSM